MGGISGRRSPIGGAVYDEMFVLSQNTEMRPLAWMSNPEVPVRMQLLRPHRDLIRPCPLQPQPEHGVFRRVTTLKLKVCCLSDRDIRRRTAPAVHVHAKGRRAGCCGSSGRCVVWLSAAGTTAGHMRTDRERHGGAALADRRNERRSGAPTRPRHHQKEQPNRQ